MLDVIARDDRVADQLEDEIGNGVYRLLFRAMATDPDEVRRFYRETVEPLVDHDREYRTDLLGTLEAYLANDCNMNATARAVFAHRHTVAHRLARIRELTGLDPSLGRGPRAARPWDQGLPDRRPDPAAVAVLAAECFAGAPARRLRMPVSAASRSSSAMPARLACALRPGRPRARPSRTPAQLLALSFASTSLSLRSVSASARSLAASSRTFASSAAQLLFNLLAPDCSSARARARAVSSWARLARARFCSVQALLGTAAGRDLSLAGQPLDQTVELALGDLQPSLGLRSAFALDADLAVGLLGR